MMQRLPVNKTPKGACQQCRTRKLRCDVLTKGSPCTNCNRCGKRCLYVPSKRRSKYRQNLLHPPSHATTTRGNDCHGHGTDLATSASSPARLTGRHRQDVEQTIEVLKNVLPEWDLCFLSSIPSSLQITPNRGADLPWYIKPLAANLRTDDLAQLTSREIFNLPQLEAVRSIFQSYIRWVHPVCPVLDVRACLEAIFKPESRKKISLLLFYAIFLSASAWVEEAHLQQLGFTCRISARRSLFERTKLLYNMGVETDKLAVIQAVVLMSNWYETDDSPDDTFFWASTGFQMAEGLQLDSHDRHASSLERESLKHVKRIFWSAFCRLSLSCLGMRRCPDRPMSAYRFPSLLEDDFVVEPLPDDILDLLENCSDMGSSDYLQRSASIFLAQATLCLHLTGVLGSLYTDPEHGLGNSPAQSNKLRPWNVSTRTVDELDKGLQAWHANLPEWLREGVSSSLPDRDSNDNEILLMSITFLKVIFLGTVIILHRPQAQVLVLPVNGNSAFDSTSVSRDRADVAADKLEEAVGQLQTHNMMGFLPLSGVTAIINAAIYSLQRALTEDCFSRLLSVRRVNFLATALISLSECHFAAVVSLSLLDTCLKRGEFEWCRQYMYCDVYNTGNTVTTPNQGSDGVTAPVE